MLLVYTQLKSFTKLQFMRLITSTKTLLLMTILGLLCLANLAAHPHVFVTGKIQVLSDDRGVTGIGLEWQFDRMTSVGIIADFDLDKNGVLSARELAELKKGAFDNLQYYNYFTNVSLGNKKLTVSKPKNFSAEIKRDVLIYRFTLGTSSLVGNTPINLLVSVYDDSFFTSFEMMKPQDVSLVQTRGSNQFKSRVTLRPGSSQGMAAYQASPQEAVVSIWKE